MTHKDVLQPDDPPCQPANRTIGRWELRKRGKYHTKAQGAPHPWSGTMEGSDSRFSQAPRLLNWVREGKWLVKDGVWLVPPEERK